MLLLSGLQSHSVEASRAYMKAFTHITFFLLFWGQKHEICTAGWSLNVKQNIAALRTKKCPILEILALKTFFPLFDTGWSKLIIPKLYGYYHAIVTQFTLLEKIGFWLRKLSKPEVIQGFFFRNVVILKTCQAHYFVCKRILWCFNINSHFIWNI